MKYPIFIFLFFLVVNAVAQNLPPIQTDVLEKNKKLEFLEGDWQLDVSWYSRDGKPTRSMKSKALIQSEMDGLLYVVTYSGNFDGKEKDVIKSWIFYNKAKKEYYDVMYDMAANFEIRHGKFNEDGELVFLMDELLEMLDSGGKKSLWRKTFYDIQENSFKLKYDFTENEGKSWVLFTTETYNRIRAKPNQSPPENLLAFLEPVIGDWYSTPDEETLKKYPHLANSISFKFEWLDDRHKVLKFYEGVRNGDIKKAILACQIAANPHTGVVQFQGFQMMNDFYYTGRYEPLKSGKGFLRIYDVYYPEGTKFKNEADRKKGKSTFRTICQLESEDSMVCNIEQLEFGKWVPWGKGKPWYLERK